MNQNIFLTRAFLFLIFFSSLPLTLSAAPGDLDSLFGNNGKVFSSVSPHKDRAEVVVTQKDQKIVVVGIADYLGKSDITLIRYLPNGKLDHSFGTEGKVLMELEGKEGVYGLAIQKDGKIIVGGYTAKNKNSSDFLILRYHPNGELDQKFGNKGKVIGSFGKRDEIHYLVLDKKERILVAGFSQEERKSKFVLARYLPDGSLDLSFNQTGFVSTHLSKEDELYGLALQKNQKILVAGSSHSKNQINCVVLRYLEDGSLDPSFGKEGVFSVEQEGETVCSSITTQPNQKILVTGYKIQNQKNSDFILARIDPSGKIDRTFGEEGYAITDFEGGIDVAHAITVLDSGKIVVAGEAETFEDKNSLPQFALARYLPNGKIDIHFGDRGKIITHLGDEKKSSAEALDLQKDGKLILVGEGEEKFAIVRYQMR